MNLFSTGFLDTTFIYFYENSPMFCPGRWADTLYMDPFDRSICTVRIFVCLCIHLADLFHLAGIIPFTIHSWIYRICAMYPPHVTFLIYRVHVVYRIFSMYHVYLIYVINHMCLVCTFVPSSWHQIYCSCFIDFVYLVSPSICRFVICLMFHV